MSGNTREIAVRTVARCGKQYLNVLDWERYALWLNYPLSKSYGNIT